MAAISDVLNDYQQRFASLERQFDEVNANIERTNDSIRAFKAIKSNDKEDKAILSSLKSSLSNLNKAKQMNEKARDYLLQSLQAKIKQISGNEKRVLQEIVMRVASLTISAIVSL